MPDTPRNAERTEKAGFDSEKALNKKGFAEFLALHEDSASGEVSPEDMEKRFELFELQSELAVEVKEVYRKEIFRDIGINLDTNDLSCIDAYMEDRAVKTPWEVKTMRAEMTRFKELPGQIQEANKEILELAKSGSGILGKIKMAGEFLFAEDKNMGKTYDAREKVEKAGIALTLEDMDARIAEIEDQVDFSVKEFKSGKWVGGNESLLRKFADVKKNLFDHTGLRKKMHVITQAKVKAQLDALVTTGDLKSARKGFEKMSSVKNDTETGLEYMADGTEAEMTRALNQKAEDYVGTQIYQAMETMRFGSNAFANLENSIKTALSENIGNKDEKESRDFIIKVIEETLGMLPAETPANQREIRAKKIMMRQLAIKLSKKV